MTVLEDYRINVPGFGTLKAGVLISDPKALDAALSSTAKIEFSASRTRGARASPG